MTQVSSLYLHVPFCVHLCNYCDFYKRKLEAETKQFEEFHQFLLGSWKRHDEFMRENSVSWLPLETIYLGGGTPSLWGPGGAAFFSKLISPIALGKNSEFTMEVDPGTWTTDLFKSWKDIGLNRVSIGTQSLDPAFLKIMDRLHSVEESLKLLEFLSQNDWNYSLDFLLGIPYSKEKKRNIQKELDTLLGFYPKHISLYILNARSKYPLTEQIPDDEYIRQEYLFVSEYLQSKGFHHYEVSNFALPGFESKHNQKYWRSESVAALGPTGTGLFSISESKAIRYKWKVSSPEVEIEELGPKELSLERIYLSLRTSDGWIPEEGMKEIVGQWSDKNYARLGKNRIYLTALGYVMLDSLMNDLFRWEASRAPTS